LLLGLRTSLALAVVLLWRKGLATLGDVTFVLTSYFIVHGYLREVGQHVANLQRSVNEMEELVRLKWERLGVEDRPHARALKVVAGAIVFDRVTFRYGGRQEALFQDFSVTIRPGERVGLVGHSGSGKTTFVKLLHRLYEVQDGRILIDGQDILDVTQASLRAQLALVSQDPILFHRSLAENISYARPDAEPREIEEAAWLANAHEFIVQQPKGYRTLLGERGVKLSGGERQRVALARAFLANSPVLVLDEATSSLDAESEAAIQEAMVRLMAGRTAIVIAHRLSTVRMLDRILVFHNGQVVEEGTHETLVRKLGGAYQRLFEKQAIHPERLSKLIRRGSLFTVPRGTAIKVLQGNRLVIKVRIMEGSMVGQQGWAQPGQARLLSSAGLKSSPGSPVQELGTEVAADPPND
jgi:ATP-binding cassette subfamily B protein